MRLVQLREGVLELRWTWLPFWLACNPVLKTELEAYIRDRCILGGVTTSPKDLDAIHKAIVDWFGVRFGEFPGLKDYVASIELVQESVD